MGLNGIGILMVRSCRDRQGLSYDGSFFGIGVVSMEIYKYLCRCMRFPEFVKWTLQWCCMGLGGMIRPFRASDKP